MEDKSKELLENLGKIEKALPELAWKLKAAVGSGDRLAKLERMFAELLVPLIDETEDLEDEKIIDPYEEDTEDEETEQMDGNLESIRQHG